MSKKGQFFIITAVMIISVLFSAAKVFMAYSNFDLNEVRKFGVGFTIHNIENKFSEARTFREYQNILENWWNDSFVRRKQINFSYWKGSATENLSNFTVLIKLNSMNINYSKTKNDGTDLRFIDSDTSTLLNYYIEKWNSSGDSFVWVKVPLLENSGTDFIWMYYNNSAAANVQNESGTYDSNYVGVWNMNNDGVNGTTVVDSSSYGNNGTLYLNSSLENAAANGKSGNANTFDGVDDYVNIIDSEELTGTLPYTLQAWIYPLVCNAEYSLPSGSAEQMNIIRKGLRPPYNLGVLNCKIAFNYVYEFGSWIEGLYSISEIPLNAWTFVCITINSTNGTKMYLKGQLDNSIIYSKSPYTAVAGSIAIGGLPEDWWVGFFKGSIDDVRISNVSRSAAWINASYLSMTNGLITFSSVESVSDRRMLDAPSNQEKELKKQLEDWAFQRGYLLEVNLSSCDYITLKSVYFELEKEIC